MKSSSSGDGESSVGFLYSRLNFNLFSSVNGTADGLWVGQGTPK